MGQRKLKGRKRLGLGENFQLDPGEGGGGSKMIVRSGPIEDVKG